MKRFIDFPRGALSGADADRTFDRLTEAVQWACEGDRNGDRLAYVIVLQSGAVITVDGNVSPELRRSMLETGLEYTRSMQVPRVNGEQEPVQRGLQR
jgi:hypothetical protein